MVQAEPCRATTAELSRAIRMPPVSTVKRPSRQNRLPPPKMGFTSPVRFNSLLRNSRKSTATSARLSSMPLQRLPVRSRASTTWLEKLASSSGRNWLLMRVPMP
ncbi:hypothetical protein D3C80_1666460 [compost metagenome]